MNIDLGGFEHEIVSSIIAFACGALWRKGVRVAKDVNQVWTRLRRLEADNKRMKEKLGLSDCDAPSPAPRPS